MASVLLIDDDPWVLKVFVQMLEAEGYDVLQATDGQQGLEIYRKTPTDIVITDMVMPFKDGLETIMDLKHEFPNIKIIAISGGGVIEPERYLALAGTIGALKTLQKPVSREILLATVKETLAD